MAIIGGRGEKADPPAGTTIIAHGTRLVGDLAVTGKLHVDGELEGQISAVGEISIGESGRVTGTVRSHRLLVAGSLDGTVVSAHLEIVKSGRVQGDIEVDQLVIERGGRLGGSSRMGMLPRKDWDPLAGNPAAVPAG